MSKIVGIIAGFVAGILILIGCIIGVQTQELKQIQLTLNQLLDKKAEIVNTEVVFLSEKERLLNVQVLKLAEAVYYETQGEGKKGKIGVAWTIKNRVLSGVWGDSYIDVITDGCQYNYNCEDVSSIINEHEWRLAVEVAYGVYNGDVPDNTMGAMYYLNPSKSTMKGKKFFRKLIRTVIIGKHEFYKER